MFVAACGADGKMTIAFCSTSSDQSAATGSAICLPVAGHLLAAEAGIGARRVLQAPSLQSLRRLSTCLRVLAQDPFFDAARADS